MTAKRNWSCICKKRESHIFTAGNKNQPAIGKWALALALVVISATLMQAQTFSRQKLVFSLFDKNGTQVTEAAINSGKVRVYSLREAKTITHSHLNFDRTNKYFTFSESAISPGMMLAFVSATDTMYLSLYGRTTDRVIEGLKVQKGSYVLTSSEFAGQKQLKVKSWAPFLEDGVAPQQQDLASYKVLLRDKRPVELVNHSH
jgi:hypothetical protein